MDQVAWKKELAACAENLEDICGLALSIETRAEDVLDQHPERVAALRQGWFRAVAYTRDHPEDAAKRMSPHFGVDAATFTDMISGLEYLDADANQTLLAAAPGPGSVHGVIEAANRIFQATGDAPKRVEASELLAPIALGH